MTTHTHTHTHTLALLVSNKGRYSAWGMGCALELRRHAGTDTHLHRLGYSHKNTHKKTFFTGPQVLAAPLMNRPEALLTIIS